MAARAHHRRILTPARALLCVVALSVTLSSTPARAHNSWTGAYRKFPWKASAGRTISVLPGQCPHCPGVESSSAWKAIDVGDMDYDTVYSIAPGTVDAVDASGGSGAGIYVRIRDDDGTYVTYEHLDSVLVSKGADIVAGQPIAVSGNTGNSTGPHLHFQRHDGPSFSSNALSLVPISSHGESGDELTRTIYTSDNAGVGYTSSGVGSSPFRATYAALGGYRSVGVTANVGAAWSPCRDEEPNGSWWRYGCSVAAYPGSIQTLYHQGKQRALMLERGASTAYLVHRGILAAYTSLWHGHDWAYYIGFPRGNRVYSDGLYRQSFENGAITMAPGSCTERVYQGGVLKATYHFCD